MGWLGRPATHCDDGRWTVDDGRWTVDDGRLTVAGPWVDAGSEGSSVCAGRTNCMRADQGWCHVGRNVDDDRCTEIMRDHAGMVRTSFCSERGLLLSYRGP